MNNNQGKIDFACAPKGNNPRKAESTPSNALESSDAPAPESTPNNAPESSDTPALDSLSNSAPTPATAPKSTTPKSPPIIFGPVLSRRFGRSLGVDLSPSKKQCNFDCVYCELHKSAPIDSMEEVLPPAQILQAITEALQAHKNIDVLTFTATGEPTLYPHLRELIASAKPLLPPHIKTLILSNGSRFAQAHDALLLFDMVKFSIDAALAKEFRKIDRPSRALDLPAMLAAIERFAREYRGELIAEVLLVEGHNDTRENLEAIAAFLRRVRVARVDIGSIDRPSAYQVRAVSDAKLAWASGFFTGLNVSLPTRAKIASENLAHKNPADKTHAQNSKAPESKSADSAKMDISKNLAMHDIDSVSAESKNADFAKVDSKNSSDIKSQTHAKTKISTARAESKKSDSQKIDSGNLDFTLDSTLDSSDPSSKRPAEKARTPNSDTTESKNAIFAKIDSDKINSSDTKSKLLDSSVPESTKAKSSKPISTLESSAKSNPLESNSLESSPSKASLAESALSETSLPEPKNYDAASLLKLIATRPIECSEAQILFDKHTLEILDSLVHDKKLTIKKQGSHTFYTTPKR